MRSYTSDVAKRAQLYIWRKQVSRSWLDKHEPLLEAVLNDSFAVIERPGRQRIALEAVTARAEAEWLREEYGGTLQPLPADWQKQMFAAAKTKPLRIGKRLTIVGDAADAGEGPVLLIPAGAAFGTGEHATTAMSLRMLERVSRGLTPGWRMLDAGTGSGILALAGSVFGAEEVLAIDDDPTAISTAMENARMNGIRTAPFEVADVKVRTRGTFDVITANLYSELLEAVLPRFRRSLASDGHLILSGVLRQQERQLTRALQANGFRIVETRRRGKWVALRCL
jgi:ribosomal protein L11 methyltransferase